MDRKVESTSSRSYRRKIPFWNQCLKKIVFCLLLSCNCSRLFHYGSVHCHQTNLISRQRQGHRDGSASIMVWLSRQHQSFVVSLESMIFLCGFHYTKVYHLKTTIVFFTYNCGSFYFRGLTFPNKIENQIVGFINNMRWYAQIGRVKDQF